MSLRALRAERSEVEAWPKQSPVRRENLIDR